MAAKNKNKFLDREGQAVFELLAFIPFLLFLFVVIVSSGNSINGSINQQKLTRRYLYYVTRGDSFAPGRLELDNYINNAGAKVIGLSSIGYRTNSGGAQKRYGSCYKFVNLYSSNSSETCNEPTTGLGETNFVRVFTSYGFCGATHFFGDEGITPATYLNQNLELRPQVMATALSCTNSE